MMGYWFGGMGWLMALGVVMFILFWGGLVWLAVWGINRATGHRDLHMALNNPLEIARERYARSEITKEQFDQIKRDLT